MSDINILRNRTNRMIFIYEAYEGEAEGVVPPSPHEGQRKGKGRARGWEANNMAD